MQNVLLDTHGLIYYISASKRFGKNSIRFMNQSQLFYSPISIFEMKQKSSIRPSFSHQVTGLKLRQLGFQCVNFDELSIDNFVQLETRDPIDRMLVAQAKGHGMKFLTADLEILDSGLDFVLDLTL